MPLLKVEVERVGQAVFYVNQADESDEAADIAHDDARVLAKSLDDSDFAWQEYCDIDPTDEPHTDLWVWTGGEEGEFQSVRQFLRAPKLSLIAGGA